MEGMGMRAKGTYACFNSTPHSDTLSSHTPLKALGTTFSASLIGKALL